MTKHKSIWKENLLLLKRIQNQASNYSVERWNKDYEKKCKLPLFCNQDCRCYFQNYNKMKKINEVKCWGKSTHDEESMLSSSKQSLVI